MPGMTFRGDRLLRYVSAFCPHCHAEDPERPLAEVRRLSYLRGLGEMRAEHTFLEVSDV